MFACVFYLTSCRFESFIHKNEELEYLNHKLSNEISELNTQLKTRVDIVNVKNVIKQLQDKIVMMNNNFVIKNFAKLLNICE